MPSFNKVRKARDEGVKPLRYELYELEPIVVPTKGKDEERRAYPTLLVMPASQLNKPFVAHMIRVDAQRKAKTRGQRKKRDVELSPDALDKDREEDRLDYADGGVVVGWENVIDDETGKECLFTVDNAKLYLQALRDDWFDRLREFCRDNDNWRPTIDADPVAKNS